MAVIIQKFGGRLLETPDRIRRAAALVSATRDAGDEPVVVVSAPGGTTDEFMRMAREVAPEPDRRELDMLLSVGERTAMALLAMAINAGGRHRAISFTGSQVGIITDTRHTDAHIIEVRGYRIREALERGEIPIVAGFQGVSTEREITTLGRGGSDATAVALAVALGAQRCELVKEKGGVHSADPELVPEAVPLPEMDYGTLEAVAAAGAGVVQVRAVSLANEHHVVLNIRDREGKRGTLVTDRCLDPGRVAAVTLRRGLEVVRGADTPEGDGAGILRFLFSSEEETVAAYDTPNKSGTSALLSVVSVGGTVDGELLRACNAVVAGFHTHALIVTGGTAAYLLDDRNGVSALRALHSALVEGGYITTVSQATVLP